jgi:hypothetical protein
MLIGTGRHSCARPEAGDVGDLLTTADLIEYPVI